MFDLCNTHFIMHVPTWKIRKSFYYKKEEACEAWGLEHPHMADYFSMPDAVSINDKYAKLDRNALNNQLI